jgi:hypothetical protein
MRLMRAIPARMDVLEERDRDRDRHRHPPPAVPVPAPEPVAEPLFSKSWEVFWEKGTGNKTAGNLFLCFLKMNHH